MIRLISTVTVVVAAVACAPVAFAKDIKKSKTFTRANGTKVVSRTSFHTKTGVTDEKVTVTRTNGDVKTIAEKVSPALKGGFTVSKSVTGFNGQTHTSTGSIGAGHGSHGGHGGHGKA